MRSFYHGVNVTDSRAGPYLRKTWGSIWGIDDCPYDPYLVSLPDIY